MKRFFLIFCFCAAFLNIVKASIWYDQPNRSLGYPMHPGGPAYVPSFSSQSIPLTNPYVPQIFLGFQHQTYIESTTMAMKTNCQGRTFAMQRIEYAVYLYGIASNATRSTVGSIIGDGMLSSPFMTGLSFQSSMMLTQMMYDSKYNEWCPPPVGPPMTNYYNILDQYYGFKQIQNGVTFYGWLHIQNNVVTEVAIETVPGYPVKVGDKIGFQGTSVPSQYVTGYVFSDTNGNGLQDSNEKGIANMQVTTSNGLYTAITNPNGFYTLQLPTSTPFPFNFSVKLASVQPALPNYAMISPVLGTYNLSSSLLYAAHGNRNFAVQPQCISRPLQINATSVFLRRCFPANMEVRVTNFHNGSFHNVTAKVVMPPFVRALSSTPAWTEQSGDTLIYKFATIEGLSTTRISIVDSVICGNEEIRGISQCIYSEIWYDDVCNPSSDWDNSNLAVNSFCVNDTVRTYIVNKGAQPQSDSTDYRIYINNALALTGKIKLAARDTFKLYIPALGNFIRVEADQTPGHPRYTTMLYQQEGCGNASTQTIQKGIAVDYPPVTNKYSSTFCSTIRDSYDPNDKLAYPEGWGEDHNILKNQELQYTVRFENTGNDEAYSIVVVDTLDASLDISSLFVLGNSHDYRLDIQRTATSSVLTFVFPKINLPAKSVDSLRSQGWITFKIKPKANLAEGTVINNKAYIFFDYNSAIITNNVKHTIATQLPVNPTAANNIKRTQYLKFDLLPEKTYGDASFTPSTALTSGETVELSSSDPSIASVNDGQIVIHKAGTVTFTAKHSGNAKYFPTESQSHQQVIHKAPLTIKAKDVSIKVDDALPVFEAEYDGFVYNEDASALTGAPTVTTTVSSSNVSGTYPITAGSGNLTSENYEFDFDHATLTISKYMQQLSFDPISNRTYGDNAFPIAASATSGNAVGFVSSDESVATVHGNYVIIHKAGNVTIQANQSGNYKYEPASSLTQSFTISKAPLHVKAHDAEMEEGTALPEFTWEYGGFVYNEDENDLNGNPSVNTTATIDSEDGEYPITLTNGSLLSDNYEFIFEEGTLTVQPAVVSGTLSGQNGNIQIAPVPVSDGHFTVQSKERIRYVKLINAMGVEEYHYSENVTTEMKGVVMVIVVTEDNTYQDKIQVQ